MHLCICYHRLTCPQKVCIYVLHLSERNFSELVGEADYTPIKFTPDLCRVWHMNIGLFCFTRCIPTTWIFVCTGFSAASNLDSILRVTLRSGGQFDFSMSPTFWQGVSKSLTIFSNCYRAILIVCPFQSPWGSLILSLGLRPSNCSYVSTSVGSCLLLRLGQPCDCKRRPMKLFPVLCFHHLGTEKLLMTSLPYSMMGFTFVSVFPRVL